MPPIFKGLESSSQPLRLLISSRQRRSHAGQEAIIDTVPKTEQPPHEGRLEKRIFGKYVVMNGGESTATCRLE
jgi:hypothetical protein